MNFQQSISNTVAKRGHSSELKKWRDAGVDPELLYNVEAATQPAPANTALSAEAGRQALAANVVLEEL